MSSAETLPIPQDHRAKRPRGSRHPAWYGGLTAQDLEVAQASFANPDASFVDIGKAFWPKMKNPAQKAHRILEKVRNSADIAALLRQFGPNLQKVFKAIDDALEANSLIITKDGPVDIPDHRVRLQAAKLVIDIQTPKGPQVVQNTTNITVERERQEAREFKKTHTREEVEAERLRLRAEWEQQQKERNGNGESDPT
jgi:hypothetical protein